MRNNSGNNIRVGTAEKGRTPRIHTNLKRFLVASVPYYCCATTTRGVEGFVPWINTNTNTNSNNIHVTRHVRRRLPSGHANGAWIAGTPRAAQMRLFSTGVEETGAGSSDTAGGDDFATTYHAPVMVNECLDALLDCERGRIRNPAPKSYKKKNRKRKSRKHPRRDPRGDEPGEPDGPVQVDDGATTDAAAPDAPPLVFVDGTLGGGGHSNALLQRLRPGDVLLGCDVDPNALETASERLSEYTNHPGTDRPLFVPVSTNFGDLAETLPTVLHPVTSEPILQPDGRGGAVDGILLDLGVSSHQIDEADRGFSFMRDGPLDMRMGRGSGSTEGPAASGGLTAADVCNEFDEGELQRIFSVYGDEPRAKTVAGAIVRHRPLSTTGELAEAIASVTPAFARNKRHGKTATCARVFQSLRIVVNNEDGVLGRVLSEACPALLRPGGRLVVMSYHSMEDRATKRIMRDGTLDPGRRRATDEKDLYGNYVGPPKPFAPVQKQRRATEEETARNPRARSAVLRVAERQDN